MKKVLLFAFALAIVFVSCKKHEPAPTPVPTLQSITLNKDTLTLHVGDATTIGYTLNPASISKKSLVWQSSDPTIVAVTDSGTLTAKKVGSAIVTLSNTNKTVTANALVTVLAAIPPIDSLKVGLLAYYPFDNSGDDFSGNENHGSVVDISSAADRHGKLNAAYHFNGFSSYISVADNQALRLANTDFTLNTWVNLDSYNDSFGSIIFSKRTEGLNNGYTWGFHGNVDSNVGKVTYGPGGGSINAISIQSIELGHWHMITSAYNFAAKQLSIYVDGTLDNISENILTTNPSITSLLYIGKDSPEVPSDGYFLHGSLDDVRIYNRKLSNADILKLYQLPSSN